MGITINNSIDTVLSSVVHDVVSWAQSFSGQDWAWLGVLLHFSLAIFMVVRILSTQRNMGVAIAWLVLLFSLPVFGIVAYILIGEASLGRRYHSRNNKAKLLIDKIVEQETLKNAEVDVLLPECYLGISRLGMVDTGFGVYSQHCMKLLHLPDSIFDALINDINSAKNLVLLEFYIVFPKGRVIEVFEALIKAAERGVECQILADSVGSFNFFNDKWHKKLTDAGVMVHQSLPVGLFKTLFKRTDLRNHRKIVVIDENVGYTGSFNLVDPQFFKQEKALGQWIDVMMRIESDAPVSVITVLSVVSVTDISAENNVNLNALNNRIDEYVRTYTRKLYVSKPAINDINTKVAIPKAPLSIVDDNKDSVKSTSQQTELNVERHRPRFLEKFFYGMSDNHHHEIHNNVKQNQKRLNRRLASNVKAILTHSKKNDGMLKSNMDASTNIKLVNFTEVENVLAQVIPSAPRLTGNVIYDTLLTVFSRADKRIQITTPYFVPDEALLTALTAAAKRGVEVILIIPKKVDSFLVRHASQASYHILMEAGVKIALFKEGLLHAKTVVIDDDYCLFGTVNMDMRSFYLNMEISLALYTPEMVAQVLACQQAYLTKCDWIDADTWKNRPKYHQLFDASIRLFSPLL